MFWSFLFRMSRTLRSPCVRRHGSINVMGLTKHTTYLCTETTVRQFFNPHYSTLLSLSPEAYFRDLGWAYRQEIRELYALGCRTWWKSRVFPPLHSNPLPGHIQIDDPTFCYFCDEDMITGMERSGVDHEALLDTYIRAINLVTHGRPNDLTISLHMCRGNYKVCVQLTFEIWSD